MSSYPILILHSWVGTERLVDEQETNECVGRFIGRYNVVSTNESWERQLKRYWDAEADIAIHEHDTCPTVAMVEAMRLCPHDLCTQAYPLYKATTGNEKVVNANRVGDPSKALRFTGIDERLEFTDFAGFGLAKLGYKSRQIIGKAWRSDHPVILDHEVGMAAYGKGLRWHQHWNPDSPDGLMKHNHREKSNVWRF